MLHSGSGNRGMLESPTFWEAWVETAFWKEKNKFKMPSRMWDASTDTRVSFEPITLELNLNEQTVSNYK
jgi:hypothetical protein